MKNVKNLSKRGLALFLALVMCLGMVQFSAFAAESESQETEVVESVETSESDSVVVDEQLPDADDEELSPVVSDEQEPEIPEEPVVVPDESAVTPNTSAESSKEPTETPEEAQKPEEVINDTASGTTGGIVEDISNIISDEVISAPIAYSARVATDTDEIDTSNYAYVSYHHIYIPAGYEAPVGIYQIDPYSYIGDQTYINEWWAVKQDSSVGSITKGVFHNDAQSLAQTILDIYIKADENANVGDEDQVALEYNALIGLEGAGTSNVGTWCLAVITIHIIDTKELSVPLNGKITISPEPDTSVYPGAVMSRNIGSYEPWSDNTSAMTVDITPYCSYDYWGFDYNGKVDVKAAASAQVGDTATITHHYHFYQDMGNGHNDVLIYYYDVYNATITESSADVTHHVYMPAGTSTTIDISKPYYSVSGTTQNPRYSEDGTFSIQSYEFLDSGNDAVATASPLVRSGNSYTGHTLETTITSSADAKVGTTTEIVVKYVYGGDRITQTEAVVVHIIEPREETVQTNASKVINLCQSASGTFTQRSISSSNTSIISTSSVGSTGYTATRKASGDATVTYEYMFTDKVKTANNYTSNDYDHFKTIVVDVTNFTVPVETDDPNSIDGLDITKTVNKTSVVGGDDLTYTLTVTNDSNVAKTVTVQDTLPYGTSYKSSVPTNGSVTVKDDTVTWTLIVQPNSTEKLTIVVTVADDARGGLTNIATLTSGDGSTDKSSVTTTATPKPTQRTKTVTIVKAFVGRGGKTLTAAQIPTDFALDYSYTYNGKTTTGTLSYAAATSGKDENGRPTLTWTLQVPVDEDTTSANKTPLTITEVNYDKVTGYSWALQSGLNLDGKTVIGTFNINATQNEPTENIYNYYDKTPKLDSIDKVRLTAMPSAELSIKAEDVNLSDVVVAKDGESVTLLYAITVEGDSGAAYTVTDTNATWVGGAGLTGTIPASGEAVIYVTKTFTAEEVAAGKATNSATVAPGDATEGPDEGNGGASSDTGVYKQLNIVKNVQKLVDGTAVPIGTDERLPIGSKVRYTVTLENTSGTDITDLYLRDVMAKELTLDTTSLTWSLTDKSNQDMSVRVYKTANGYIQDWKLEGIFEQDAVLTLTYDATVAQHVENELRNVVTFSGNKASDVEAVAYMVMSVANDLIAPCSDFDGNTTAAVLTIAGIEVVEEGVEVPAGPSGGSFTGEDNESIKTRGFQLTYSWGAQNPGASVPTDSTEYGQDATATVQPGYAGTITVGEGDDAKTYEFASWLGSDGNSYQPGGKITVTGDLTLTAQWKDKEGGDTPETEYTVTIDPNNGEDRTTETVKDGEKFTVPATPTAPEDKEFTGWLGSDGNSYQPGAEITVTGNLTLTAQWKDKETNPPETEHTVTIDPNNGEEKTTSTVKDGENFTVPAAPTAPEGKEFDGWKDQNGKTYQPGAEIEVTDDLTLTAQWKNKETNPPETEHTVTIDPNNGEDRTTETVKDGEKFTVPAAPTAPEGKEFDGWKDQNGNSYQPGNEIEVTDDLTLTAQWKDKEGGDTPETEYTVTFDSNGGSAVASQTVKENGTATRPTDPTRSGYTFAGWYLNGTAYNFNAPVTGNITLTAQWTQNTTSPSSTTYTLVYNANGGEGAPASVSQTNNSTFTISSTEPVRDGYTFVGWATSAAANEAGYQSGDQITISGTRQTLYAVWSREQDIEEGEPPLAELPDEEPPLAELPDEEPPLAELPDEDAPLTEEPVEIEIPEEKLPMADVPKTGDNSLLWLMTAGIAGAGLALLTLGKKRKDDVE